MNASEAAGADEAVAGHSAENGNGEPGGLGSLGPLVGLLVLTWTAGIASFPLRDNSFLTHLATGRLILDEGRVPTADPYTFTAAGEDWTVQSWLASVAYAGAEQVAGASGIKVVVLASMLAAGWLLWRLSDAAESVVLRIVVLTPALLAATAVWSERPFMIAVIGVGVLWLALEGHLRPFWLVPLLWLWANTHGSYPLAAVLCVLVIAGSYLDQRSAGTPVDLRGEGRVLGAVVAGSLLAVVGPLGFRVLLFPFTALTRSGILGEVQEWQPPGFESVSDRAFLGLVALAVLALVRTGRWRSALPALFVICASVVAQRNMAVALMVLVPVAAEGMLHLGELRARTRLGLGAPLFVLLSVLLLLVGGLAVLRTGPDLSGYPQRPLAWLGPEAPQTQRLAAQERTGNLLEALDGPRGTVFFDDRFDMFPPDRFEDYLSLSRARPQWHTVLERYDIDAVVWDRSQPLASLVAASPAWRVVFSDSEWMVACLRDASCPGR